MSLRAPGTLEGVRREAHAALAEGVRGYDDVVRLGAILGAYVDYRVYRVGDQAGRREDARGARLAATVEALGALRPLGDTELGTKSVGATAEADELDAVARLVFPEAWIRRSNEHSDLEVARGRVPTGGVGECLLFGSAFAVTAFHLGRQAIEPGAPGPAVFAAFSELCGAAGALAAAVVALVFALVYARRGARILRVARSGVYGRYRPASPSLRAPARIYMGTLRRGDGREERERWRAVAVHELCHRFEEVMPQISELEREFLDRRLRGCGLHWRGVTLDASAERWRHRVHGSRPGRSLLGGLVAPPRLFAWYAATRYYTGRTPNAVPDAAATRHYEVFSTAYAAMMFGDLDERSFSLRTDRQPDEEHRNLVLGILASV